MLENPIYKYFNKWKLWIVKHDEEYEKMPATNMQNLCYHKNILIKREYKRLEDLSLMHADQVAENHKLKQRSMLLKKLSLSSLNKHANKSNNRYFVFTLKFSYKRIFQ